MRAAVVWVMVGWWIGLASASSLAAALSPANPSSPSEITVSDLLRRIVQRAHEVAATTNTPVLKYDKRSLYETFDTDGTLKRAKEKVYEVTLLRGMTFNKLVEVEGRRLSEAESQALSEKENKWRDTYAGGEKGSAADRMDVLINEELIARFDFTLVGQENLHGRPVVRLDFQPKTTPLPANRLMDRVVNLLHGSIWIDTKDYEIARATTHTEGPLRLWGGVLGSLEAFELHVDREPSPLGAWFIRHSEVTVRARRLFTSMHIRAREVGSGLRPAS